MGKPQLNLDKKDDVKTPDGSLVKVITVNEPLPVKQEPVYLPTTTRTGCRAGKVLCTLLCTLLFIVLLFMLVSYLFYPYGYSGFRCGVGYYDDVEYYGNDYIDYGSSGGPMPYGSDILFAPRPTGAPLLQYLEEGVSFNADLSLIHIKTSEDPLGVSIIHDFELHLSAYKVPSSEVCYISPLNTDSSLTPEDFKEHLESEAYRNQEFPVSREIYTVDPTEAVNDFGEHIGEMCSGYETYNIHSIPDDQIRAFLQTIRELVRGRGRHHGSSSEDEDRVRGGRRHGSHSSSSEEDQRDGLRRTTLRDYFDNIRSFDGQQVVDIHVFQVHSLDMLTDADLARLLAFKDNGDLIP